jgi:hypothetical protein
MVEPVQFQTVFQFLQTFSIIVGIGYYVYNLRMQNKSRQAQIYLSIWPRLASTEMMHSMGYDNKMREQIASYEDWRKLMEEDQKYNDSFDFIGTSFEAVGVFVNEDLLELRVFLRDIGGYYPKWWRKYRDFIEEHRVRMKAPRYYIECELLYDKIMEFAKKNPDFMIPTE